MNVLTRGVLAALALLAALAVGPATGTPRADGRHAPQAPASDLTVTRADDGATLRPGAGERFILELGNDLDWTVTVADESVVRRVPNIAVVVGAQGMYEALREGETELSATGMVHCPPDEACPLLLAVFRLDLEVLPAAAGGLLYNTVVPALSRDGPAASYAVTGQVLAGPTCPVERIPPDPRCAARPVSGAVLLFIDNAGRDAGRAVSDDNGRFTILLPAGRYRLRPLPVVGLLGTAPPQDVIVTSAGARVTVTYDTGIR